CIQALNSESSRTFGIQPIMPSGGYGLTLQEHPVIFIDFGEEIVPSVELRVRSENGDYSERVRLPMIPNQPIQGFSLPSDRPPLDIGQNYQWTLLVACDDTISPNHPIFIGWVQRVALSQEVAAELDAQSVSNQVIWYASRGYWYDVILAVQGGLQGDPNNRELQTLWDEILSVAAESATAPLN
ncbi:MAG: DUF928 domain-containing protein, partial [Symploca sp. SIO3C6]|nr:DUF928 domain-containing protein [Symploca sp. SIO3C6]